MDLRGTVGRIYKEEYYTELHTKYYSSAFQGGAIFDPSGMICRIYVELNMSLMHAKYRSFRACGFR